jgi:hypothetical protein
MKEARRLLRAQADQDPYEKGITPLFVASLEGHLDVVEELLSVGASVHGALEAASSQGHDNVVATLQATHAARTAAMASLCRALGDVADLLPCVMDETECQEWGREIAPGFFRLVMDPPAPGSSRRSMGLLAASELTSFQKFFGGTASPGGWFK